MSKQDLKFETESTLLRRYVASNSNVASSVCSGTFSELPFITVTRNKESVTDKLTVVDPLPITLPVTPSLCQSLINEGFCQKAPFGRGMETVMDPTIRRAWQIESDHVTIYSEEIRSMLCGDSRTSPLLESVKSVLAPQGRIYSEFYKLLVYEKGDFFKLHKDTQRKQNHFASLIVFLPSAYEGGELVIHHLGKAHSFSNSLNRHKEKEKPLHCTWVAFFTDCDHEILPLLDGCRMALAFNLFKELSSTPEVPVSRHDIMLENHLHRTFRAMKEDSATSGYSSIGLLLDHNYTLSSMKPEYLKGEDFRVYQMFSGLTDFDIELTLIRLDMQELYGGGTKFQQSKNVLKASFDYLSGRDCITATIRRKTDRSKVWKTREPILEHWKMFSPSETKRSGEVYFMVSPSEIRTKMQDMSDHKGFVLGNTGTYYFDLEYCQAALIITPKKREQMFSEPTNRFHDVDIFTAEKQEELQVPKQLSLSLLKRPRENSFEETDQQPKHPRFH